MIDPNWDYSYGSMCWLNAGWVQQASHDVLAPNNPRLHSKIA